MNIEIAQLLPPNAVIQIQNVQKGAKISSITSIIEDAFDLVKGGYRMIISGIELDPEKKFTGYPEVTWDDDTVVHIL